jgi:xylan 1,4-beta-xylosidase
MDVYPQNGYRNGTMYSSYTAASFARKMDLAAHFGVNFEGAVTWAFEFENQPWFHGFRDLATNGVDKPVLNVFRMFGMMQGNRVEVKGNLAYDFLHVRDSSVRGQPSDINALAAKDGHTATIMVWNYHDDDLAAPDAPVEVKITGLPAGRVMLHHFRIDKNYSNSYTAWQDMDAPQYPTASQYAELEAAGKLQLLDAPKWITTREGETLIDMALPRQGVSLLRFSW